jgi:hypothetical protein
VRCLQLEEWLGFLSGGGDKEEALVHSAECPGCGRILDELEEMLGALSGLRAEGPPHAVAERARGLMLRKSWLGRAVGEVVACLTADSSAVEPIPTRGPFPGAVAEIPTRRYLRFEAGSCVAELHAVRREQGRYEVAGRLLYPQAEAPFAVLALGSRGFGYPRMSDGSGRFHFADLPPDRYELRLELDEADLVLAPLPLP